MARATLISQARGERVYSTGTHRRRMLDALPLPEVYSPDEQEILASGRFSDSDLADFERMMRGNRAAGL